MQTDVKTEFARLGAFDDNRWRLERVSMQETSRVGHSEMVRRHSHARRWIKVNKADGLATVVSDLGCVGITPILVTFYLASVRGERHATGRQGKAELDGTNATFLRHKGHKKTSLLSGCSTGDGNWQVNRSTVRQRARRQDWYLRIQGITASHHWGEKQTRNRLAGVVRHSDIHKVGSAAIVLAGDFLDRHQTRAR